ncbi:hypothetical protein M758_UG036400 [Ceratodon purpureus]|nr:hypothetical protein M758_UG036400 [Ceratodon purpureus]
MEMTRKEWLIAADWLWSGGRNIWVCQDDPRATQPLTYQKILNHPTSLQLYSQKLIYEGIVSQEDLDKWVDDVDAKFEAEYAAADSYAPTLHEWLASNWQGEALGSSSSKRYIQPTGLDLESLRIVGCAISTPPAEFNLHPDVSITLIIITVRIMPISEC